MNEPKIQIFGVAIQPWRVTELFQKIQTTVEKDEKALILNVNVNCLNLAYENFWLREFLNSSAAVFCDGAGVILGAKILGFEIPERITYADWTWQLAEFAEIKGIRLYFLGGTPGVAERAAMKIKSAHPSLCIAGCHHGYFDKTTGSKDNYQVIQMINNLKPNVLIVAFGMPLQEKWLMENWGQIEANIALTGGAVFDYVSGDLRRAPRWMTDHGLEWLGRFLIDPQRLWKRYILGNPLFLWRILLQRAGFVRQ